MALYYFFEREQSPEHPSGQTVSKRDALPNGDFQITKYSWGNVSLWFVDVDEFTANERQEAYLSFTTALAPQEPTNG